MTIKTNSINEHKIDRFPRKSFVSCTSFSCSGVETEATRQVVDQVWVLGMERVVKKRTPHGTTAVEALLTDSDDDIPPITSDDLGTRNHETIGVRVGNVRTPALGLSPERIATIIVELLDVFFVVVGLTGYLGFVAHDTMTRYEDAITGDDLAGLEEGDITYAQFLDVDDTLYTGSFNLDATLLLFVKDAQLTLLSPMVNGFDRRLWM